MAYSSSGVWQDEDAGVANRIAAITAGNSDFIKQARTSGMQAANRRGLGNSSMAVAASEGAAIDRAAPIAAQEAQQINQRNLSGQEFRQQGMISAQDFRQQGSLSDQDFRQRGGLADQQFQYQRELDAAKYAAAEREMQARAITDLNSQRMSAFANTLQNDKIPASARAEAQRSINDQQADAIARLEQLYGVSLAASPPASAGGGAGGPPPASVDWAAYVQANPDALENWNAIRNTPAGRQFGGNIAAFGQFHYAADGSRRDLSRFSTGAAPAPTAPRVMSGPGQYGLGNVPWRGA